MIQAVIMAAGRSTRTAPLTDTRPKPLIPIWGEPHLAHQLRQLAGWVDEVILVVGYEQEQIRAAFGASYQSLPLRYAVQKTARGTADALLTAAPHIRGDFLVLNGDDFYHKDDLQSLSQHDAAVMACEAPDPQNRSVIEHDGARVTAIVEKPPNPAPDSLCGVGAYRFQREDLTHLEDLPVSPRGELELPDFVTRIIQSKNMGFQQVRRFWLPLTYAWDPLSVILFLWERPERAAVFGLEQRPPKLARELRISGPVWFGDELEMADDVEIVGPSVIGSGSVIEKGATIERSVLFERVRIGAGARVSHSVLGARVSVGQSSQLLSGAGDELSVVVKDRPVTPHIERFGAAIGDRAEIPENARIPPGTLISPETRWKNGV